MPRLTVVSGGQTGVDRGALRAALDRDAPCGGWCPEGRLAEDGTIPAVYPVRPLPGGGYAARSRRNVEDSDGTAIVYNGDLEGGTRLTVTACEAASKPRVLIDTRVLGQPEAVQALLAFIARNDIRTLNVAGPRASKWPEAHDVALSLLSAVLAELESAA